MTTTTTDETMNTPRNQQTNDMLRLLSDHRCQTIIDHLSAFPLENSTRQVASATTLALTVVTSRLSALCEAGMVARTEEARSPRFQVVPAFARHLRDHMNDLLRHLEEGTKVRKQQERKAEIERKAILMAQKADKPARQSTKV